MPKWTAEQEQAINLEGTNILVSAGAGSGKTAVLSERALRKVKEGVNIDEILILTFTKAAAYEMMLRIRDKIAKAGFTEQVNRIDKAYITTFDSFALSVVKKYHDRINLEKNVKVVDENVISLLKKETLDNIFNDYYHNITPEFEKLITDFCLRDDKELKKYILTINDKLDLKYDKNEYIDNYIDEYYNIETITKRKDEYEKELLKIIDKISYSLSILELSLDGNSYYEFYDILEPLLNSKTYNEIKECLDIKLPRLPKNSGDEAKEKKDEIKKYIDELIEMCIYESSNKMIEEYLSTKDYVKVILDIIKKLDSVIMNYKIENNAFEFIDISKLAITLVKDNPDIRDELKYYFNEIMIDEYQDTSDLQEEFIKLIENNNTYMVGDIKQSIYRFRNANPLIFKDKYDNYAKEINGRKIDLNKNFRSRKEVLDNINEFFDFIMDDDFGGANYQESHRMVFGNNTYINEGLTDQNYNTDIYNYKIEKDSEYSKYTKDEIEAFIIANDIKKKVNDKYQIFDKDTCILRDIKYSDFVVLMDRSSKFTLYKKIFEYMKIPLTILKDENIMEENEVHLIKNILKLIECLELKEYDNTFKYCFVSIARSYLFNYPDNEIFLTIKNDKYFESDIIKKAKEIVELLPVLDLKSLIEKIKEIYLFDEKLITIGNVEMGISVLEYFLELSQNLQELGYDYHRFIVYLDNIIESKKEIKIPVSVSDDDSCKIMTIHKSKGLEYPICYYSGVSAPFNVSDLKEKVLFDNKYGIITPCFKEGYKDTFYKVLLKKKFYLEEISEKIRLFYVALTRCKEKMIVITSLEDDELLIEDGLVSSSRREQYRSFQDILKSIYYNINKYAIPVSLDDIEISSKYKILTLKDKMKIEGNKIVVNEYQEITEEVENKHFSKTINKLIDKKTLDNMKFGTRIHEVLEFIDFKNPELNNLNLTEYEKGCINSFLEHPILKDISKANIIKEYEFYTTDKDNNKKHGIIDLMLEYYDYIDIIDYKLKHVEDNEYIDQLKGYQEYIKNKTNKKVNIYLYSILDRKINSINWKFI